MGRQIGKGDDRELPRDRQTDRLIDLDYCRHKQYTKQAERAQSFLRVTLIILLILLWYFFMINNLHSSAFNLCNAFAGTRGRQGGFLLLALVGGTFSSDSEKESSDSESSEPTKYSSMSSSTTTVLYIHEIINLSCVYSVGVSCFIMSPNLCYILFIISSFIMSKDSTFQTLSNGLTIAT